MKNSPDKKHSKGKAPLSSGKDFVFHRKNYIVMFIGLAMITLGFLLMSGGGSDDPQVFNPDIYNFRRIRLAPTLVLLGLGIEVYAILMNPNKKKSDS